MDREPEHHEAATVDAPEGPSREPFRPLDAIVKRGLDVAGGLVGLVLCAPLLAACVVWIRLIDPGPALYRQWRVGRRGWLFRIAKLRTMRLDAESGGARFAASNDPRVLPGCHWMRRSHVDELPQLWNILVGQMSLVGPRPERPEMLEQLRRRIPRIDRRHAVRPGLTGLAQLLNGYTNDVQGARRKQALDLRYLRHPSLLAEFGLLARTVTRLWDPAAM